MTQARSTGRACAVTVSRTVPRMVGGAAGGLSRLNDEGAGENSRMAPAFWDKGFCEKGCWDEAC